MIHYKSIQGRVLEDIDNYNMLYAITEICTADPETCKGCGLFSMEGNSYNVAFVGGYVIRLKDSKTEL